MDYLVRYGQNAKSGGIRAPAQAAAVALWAGTRIDCAFAAER